MKPPPIPIHRDTGVQIRNYSEGQRIWIWFTVLCMMAVLSGFMAFLIALVLGYPLQ